MLPFAAQLTKGEDIVPGVSQVHTLQRKTFPAKAETFENVRGRGIADKHVGPQPMGLQAIESELNQRVGGFLSIAASPPMAMKAIPHCVVLTGGIARFQAAAADEVAGSLLDDRKSMDSPRDF